MTDLVLPSLGPAVPLGQQDEQPISEDQRLQQCNAAIGVALSQYGCILQAVPFITAEGRVLASVQLIIRK